jgi:hypothetical protein
MRCRPALQTTLLSGGNECSSESVPASPMQRRLDAMPFRPARRQLVRREAWLDRQPRDQGQQRPQHERAQRRAPREGPAPKHPRGAGDRRATTRGGAPGSQSGDRRERRRHQDPRRPGRTPSSFAAGGDRPQCGHLRRRSVAGRARLRPGSPRVRARAVASGLRGADELPRKAPGSGCCRRRRARATSSSRGASTGQLDVVVLTTEAGAAVFVPARVGGFARAYRCAVPPSN